MLPQTNLYEIVVGLVPPQTNLYETVVGLMPPQTNLYEIVVCLVPPQTNLYETVVGLMPPQTNLYETVVGLMPPQTNLYELWNVSRSWCNMKATSDSTHAHKKVSWMIWYKINKELTPTLDTLYHITSQFILQAYSVRHKSFCWLTIQIQRILIPKLQNQHRLWVCDYMDNSYSQTSTKGYYLARSYLNGSIFSMVVCHKE